MATFHNSRSSTTRITCFVEKGTAKKTQTKLVLRHILEFLVLFLDFRNSQKIEERREGGFLSISTQVVMAYCILF